MGRKTRPMEVVNETDHHVELDCSTPTFPDAPPVLLDVEDYKKMILAGEHVFAVAGVGGSAPNMRNRSTNRQTRLASHIAGGRARCRNGNPYDCRRVNLALLGDDGGHSNIVKTPAGYKAYLPVLDDYLYVGTYPTPSLAMDIITEAAEMVEGIIKETFWR